MRLSSPFVITITRQIGSGGAYIGQELAKKLKIFYADREIISQAAKKLSVLEDDLDTRDEKVSSFWETYMQSYSFAFPDVYIPPQIIVPTDNDLFNAESEIIRQIAKERSAVIIGRCGSHILREHPNHVSLFFHADAAFRKDRVQKLYKVSQEDAAKMIARSDKERTRYHNTLTDREWTDATQYDLCMDTGRMSLDECVEFILRYLQQ